MKKKDKPSISIMIPKEKHAVGAPSSFYSFLPFLLLLWVFIPVFYS